MSEEELLGMWWQQKESQEQRQVECVDCYHWSECGFRKKMEAWIFGECKDFKKRGNT